MRSFAIVKGKTCTAGVPGVDSGSKGRCVTLLPFPPLRLNMP